MSPGLFKYFADESVGVFYMNWDLENAAPSSTYTPPPSSTWSEPTSTSTWTPPIPTSFSSLVDLFFLLFYRV